MQHATVKAIASCGGRKRCAQRVSRTYRAIVVLLVAAAAAAVRQEAVGEVAVAVKAVKETEMSVGEVVVAAAAGGGG